MTNTVKELIEKHIADFETVGKEDYTNIIVTPICTPISFCILYLVF